MDAIRNNFFWLLLILLMSAYVLYAHATDCQAVSMDIQLERHERMVAGNSDFYNPWQYRIFSMLLLEGLIRIFPSHPEVLPFFTLHFFQLVLIFYLGRFYYRKLEITNPYLVAAGLMILCYNMANSSFRSDLSFNTYFDVVFYYLAAIIILEKKFGWIIPISLLAALNRETSAFIPLMVLIPLSWNSDTKPQKKWILSGISMACFMVVLIAIRGYYGYRPSTGIHGMTSPVDFFVFNVTFLRTYPLLLGTLGVLPLIVLFGLFKLPVVLRSWFWLIVPLWFVIHLIKSNAMETRLFLVPQALIFLPAFLWLVEKWYRDQLPTIK